MEDITGRILFGAVILVSALGLWALGVKTGKPAYKQFAVVLVIMPLLAFGFPVAWHAFGWDHRAFFTTASGPWHGEPSIRAEFPFPVTEPSLVHDIEVLPRAPGGEKASGSVTLTITITSPKKAVLAQFQHTVNPAKGRAWSSIRERFQPTEEGDYEMAIEIPRAVGQVQVWVREVRK